MQLLEVLTQLECMIQMYFILLKILFIKILKSFFFIMANIKPTNNKCISSKYSSGHTEF